MSRSTLVPILFSCLLLGALAGAAFAQKPDDPGRAQFRGAAFPVAEEAGTVVVTVKRQRGSTGAVTVDYETTDGTAIDGEDYEATSGTLEWADGDRSDKTFEVTILDDDVDEGQETFGVVLSNPTEGLEIGSPSSAVVRIKPSDRSDDDDDGGDDGDDGGDDGEDDDLGGVVKLTASSFTAFESAGEATFVVERADGSTGAASVDYTTVDAGASEGEDYLGASGTLQWADGESGEKSVVVPLVDDSESEDLETITVLLTRAEGADLGVRDVGSIVIVDDDGGEGACVPDENTLCLLDGRFQVTGTWTNFEEETGDFHFIPATDEVGLAWFFDDSNVELLIKVLDACPLNGHYWVFFAASTNVGFTLEVTDLDSGEVETYENPVGTLPLATTDTSAFETCG